MKLDRFILNSDYTAAKQKGRYTLSLSVPSKYISDGSVSFIYTSTITVPQGAYFENVNITSSLDNENYSGNNVGFSYDYSNKSWSAYLSVYQSTPTQYTFACTLNGYNATTTAFTANAVVNLSISPF
jgi:hypothetical protein